MPEHRFVYDQIDDQNDSVISPHGVLTAPLGGGVGRETRRHRRPTRLPRAFTRVHDRVTWDRGSGRLREGIGTASPDVVHAHFGMMGAQLLARGPLDVPVVTTFYGNDISQCLQSGVWRSRYRPLVNSGSRFVVLTETVVDRLVDIGCVRESIDVWDIGLHMAEFAAVQRRPPVDGALRVLCAARFAEKKGHATLIDGFAEFARGNEATLTLVGYGPLKHRIRKWAQQRGISDRLTIIDMAGRADFPRVYRALLASHDVFALTSTTATDGDDEGGPALTAVLAQASGMPAVLTHFPGAERTIHEGVTGRFTAEDPRALAAILRDYASEPAHAQAIGAAGAALVHDRFNVDRQRARMAAIYRSAIRP